MNVSRVIPVLILTVVFGFAGPVFPASDVFLKLGDIKGESRDAEHKDEIDVLSWSWQMSAPQSSTLDGTTRTSGRSIIRPLLVKKYVDKASPKIAMALLQGAVIPQAILAVRKAGDSFQEYLVITMDNVIVTHHANETGPDRELETVALSFSKLCYKYTEFDGEGSAMGNIEECWDIETSQPL
jgi:type VI secretion system secreted protein Hcp